MNKHKKTRKEKMRADLHRKLQIQKQVQTFYTSSTSAPTISVSPQPMATTITRTYPYLVRDLIKTSILTVGIIASQLFLFYLLKTHIVKIPSLVY